MQASYRDLASTELWDKWLDRSRRRRALAAQGRREMTRKKQASAAVSAAMMMTQTAPAFAAALGGGGGSGAGSNVAQSSPANRAIAPAVPGEPLRLGSSGPDVARVQATLGIATDGIFGPQTDAAVRAFQQKVGLAADGIVGAATWHALFDGGTTGASLGTAKPRFGFTIQRASAVESAHVRPAIGGRGPVAKILVRTIPNAGGSAGSTPAVVRRTHGGGGNSVDDVAPVSHPERNMPSAGGNAQPIENVTAAPAPAGNFRCGSGRIVAPVKHYVVTGRFGESRPGHRHAGLDLAAPSGTPIVAAACGVVTEVGVEAGYGNMVCVRHSSSFTTCYAHMSRFATRVGAQVHAGQLIGYVGCTGSCTGPHVHFETRVNGTAQDPAPYLSGARRAKTGHSVAAGSGTHSAKASPGGGG